MSTAQGDLDAIFNPRSVAIAGAGSLGIGQAFLTCLLDSGYSGKIYPLSPKGGTAMGLPVHHSVTDISDEVDLVIACIPARFAVQLIEDCAVRGVKAVCFYTAGFGERGDHLGWEAERRLLAAARAKGIRILGPNCVGIYHPKVGLSFSSDNPRESGSAGLICQSGGNAIYTVRAAAHRGVRFTKAVSYGNALDIDESELLTYFGQDSETKAVAAYIEGIKDGRRFFKTLREVGSVKPVIVLKAGRTEAGARAAASHTSALAGSDIIWDSLLHQAGAIRVDTTDELADMLVAFSFLPVPKGRSIGVWGGGGGLSVMMLDQYSAAGFILPPSSSELQERIWEEIKTFVNTDAGFILNNPFDITTLNSPEGHYRVVRALADSDSFDMLVGQVSINNSGWPHKDFGLSVWPDFFTDAAIKVHRETGKPLALVMHSILTNWDSERVLALQQKCCEAGLPVFRSIPAAAKAMERFLRYHERRQSA